MSTEKKEPEVVQADTPQEKPAAVSMDTPVPQEVLERIRSMGEAESNIARELLDLELRKVELLRSGREISRQKDQIFGQILAERNLPDTAIVRVGANGMVSVVQPSGPQPG